jgi:3-oxoacyl-[acyl-carrier-protein] synthase I
MVYVVAAGASTALGRSALTAAAAVRAGLAAQSQHPYMVDRLGKPMVLARAPWLPAELGLRQRMTSLMLEAFKQALAPVAPGLKSSRAPFAIVVGLPAERPGWRPVLQRALLKTLERSVPEGVALSIKTALSLGHVAGLSAMQEGCRLIHEGHAHVVVVGGVESYIDRETLEWLDWTGQLAGETNPRGFVPGEAAAFCVLASDEAIWRAGFSSLGLLGGCATEREPRLRRDQAVCIGDGLTQAFKRTLACIGPGERVDQLIYDFNGQPHRAEEYGFAMLRVGERFRDPTDLRTPAQCWGDVGAASGPLFAILALAAAARGYSQGPNTLFWTNAMLAEQQLRLRSRRLRSARPRRWSVQAKRPLRAKQRAPGRPPKPGKPPKPGSLVTLMTGQPVTPTPPGGRQ